jgi:Putative beta-barrel porin 2
MISRAYLGVRSGGDAVSRRVLRRSVSLRGGAGIVVFGAALTCFGTARAQIGPPTGTDRFTLDATGGVAYDSNISGGNTTVAALRQLVPEDVTYTLGTTASFQLPSSRQTLFVDGGVNFQRHQNNSILNGEDYRISAGLSERLGLCSGTGIVGYTRRQSLIQDLAVAAARNIQSDDTANVDVVCGRRAIFVEMSGSYSKVTNDATQSGFVDSATQGVSASVGYKSQTLGDISFVGQYSTIDYMANLLLGTTQPPVTQYGAGLKYSRKIGLRLSGTAGVSYNRIEGGVARTSSDGLNANASLAYRLTSRTQFTLDYTLGNSASPLTNTSYVRTEVLQLTGSYELTRRVSFNAAASRSQQDYRGVQDVAVLQLRESTTDQLSGSVDVKLGRKASVSLNVTHTNRDADISQFNYSDDRVAVTLSSRF